MSDKVAPNAELDKDYASLIKSVKTQMDGIADLLDVPFSERDFAAIARLLSECDSQKFRMSQLRTRFGRAIQAQTTRVAESGADRAKQQVELKRLRNLQTESIRLLQWVDKVVHCVQFQMEGGRTPLYPQDPPRGSVQDIQYRMTDAAILLLDNCINPMEQDESCEDYGLFSDIRLSSVNYIAHIHAAYRVARLLGFADRARFLDVGCGGGVKVSIASQIFKSCTGLEYDPGYAASARNFFEYSQTEDCDLIEGDALAFEDYAEFEVIYFFQPMKDAEKLHELERRITGQARQGTILIAPYDGFKSRAEALGAGHVDGRVFINGVTAEEAEDVKRDAEYCGASVETEVQLTFQPDTFRKITHACYRNGFKIGEVPA